MRRKSGLKWFFVAVCCCVALLQARAQEAEPVQPQSQAPVAPDNDAIRRAIENPGSQFYYPALFTRYMTGDTTLTGEDYRHLYYGYVWQDTYKPLEDHPAKAKLLMIFEANPDPSDNELVLRQIVHDATEVLQAEPFNPTQINFLTFAYGKLGDTVNERINHDRFTKIIETIRSTGTGLTEQSPWHVIAFSHATDVMVTMQLATKRPVVVSSTVEYFQLIERQDRIRGYYFNYERIYWFRPDTLPERGKRDWEFNGMPLNRR